MQSRNGINPKLRELLEERQMLRERLHRVIFALALTEDLLAETFERLADTPSARNSVHTLSAKRARSAAAECRAFAERLEDVQEPGIG
ncbi:MAG TPA: hypothetical protein VFH54_07745 [Mycobacteriales bacterium]|nr:hypothetical protein [Mycobacteriales bacterium]